VKASEDILQANQIMARLQVWAEKLEIEERAYSMIYLTFPSTSANCRIPVARSVTGRIWPHCIST
jgi:hypothetical protein